MLKLPGPGRRGRGRPDLGKGLPRARDELSAGGRCGSALPAVVVLLRRKREEAVKPEGSVGEDARQVSPPFPGLSPLNLPLAPQMIQQVLVSEVPCRTSPGADQRILHDIK